MSNRRELLTGTALAGVALALTACAGPSASTTDTVAGVMTKMQAALSYYGAISGILTALAPSTAPLVATLAPYLTEAQAVLGTVSSTMRAAEARPLVTQFVTVFNGAIAAARQIVPTLPSSAQTGVNSVILEAGAVIDALSTFVSGVSPTIKAGAALGNRHHLFLADAR